MADPESQGMRADVLAQINPRVEVEAPQLSALLVVRGGAIVFEQYYHDFPTDQRINVWSVAKSVTGLAVGVAFHEGVLTDLGQTVGALVPNRIPADADPRVAGITLEQLLTMTAGWGWDTRTNFARHSETDQVDVMLDREMVCDPGMCFEYDSTCPNLLSVIIQDLTGELMADYLRSRLFEPLGITRFEWLTTDYGATRGAGGLELTARDMAKIGFFALNNGLWDGQQIVDESWIAESATGHVSGTSASSGANIGNGGRYGYQWWVTEVEGYPAYFASGYGGQVVFVVPGLDLVVVTGFAGADVDSPDQQQSVHPIIREVIVPAAL